MKGLVLVAVLLTGCDVPGRLVLVNRSGYPATVRYIMKGEDYWNQRVYSLDAGGPKRNSYQMFGFGHTWSDENIRQYLGDVARIDFVTRTDSTSVADPQDLFELLRSNRKGLSKKAIRLALR